MAKVLLADDNQMLRKTVRKILEQGGHEVVEARDGREAMEQLHRSRMDVVLLDIVMPGQGGMETLFEMSGSRIRTRVIIMTGRIDTGTEAFKNLCLRFRAEKVLTKPFRRKSCLRLLQANLPFPAEQIWTSHSENIRNYRTSRANGIVLSPRQKIAFPYCPVFLGLLLSPGPRDIQYR